MANIFVDNTNIVRVTNAKLTTIAGGTTLVTEPGTYVLKNAHGVEVAGQSWPAALTLNSPGNYAGFLEANLALVVGDIYTLEVTIGSGPVRSAFWTCSVRVTNRPC